MKCLRDGLKAALRSVVTALALTSLASGCVSVDRSRRERTELLRTERRKTDVVNSPRPVVQGNTLQVLNDQKTCLNFEHFYGVEEVQEISYLDGPWILGALAVATTGGLLLYYSSSNGWTDGSQMDVPKFAAVIGLPLALGGTVGALTHLMPDRRIRTTRRVPTSLLDSEPERRCHDAVVTWDKPVPVALTVGREVRSLQVVGRLELADPIADALVAPANASDLEALYLANVPYQLEVLRKRHSARLGSEGLTAAGWQKVKSTLPQRLSAERRLRLDACAILNATAAEQRCFSRLGGSLDLLGGASARDVDLLRSFEGALAPVAPTPLHGALLQFEGKAGRRFELDLLRPEGAEPWQLELVNMGSGQRVTWDATGTQRRYRFSGRLPAGGAYAIAVIGSGASPFHSVLSIREPSARAPAVRALAPGDLQLGGLGDDSLSYADGRRFDRYPLQLSPGGRYAFSATALSGACVPALQLRRGKEGPLTLQHRYEYFGEDGLPRRVTANFAAPNATAPWTLEVSAAPGGSRRCEYEVTLQSLD